MSIGLENYPNVIPPDSDYPSGRSKDTPNGTPMKELTMGDYQQLFAKLLREALTPANGLPDNEYNGNQYYEALTSLFGKYGKSQIVTSNYYVGAASVDDNLFNPFLLVPPGASSGIEITLSINAPRELSTITIVNDSSNSVDLISNDYALDYVVPSPSTIYTLAAGKSIEITFIVISGQFNWVISKKP